VEREGASVVRDRDQQDGREYRAVTVWVYSSAMQRQAEGVTRLIGQVALQLIIVVILVAIAQSRRHRVNWPAGRANRVQWLCGIYLVLLYLAAFLGTPGLGVLGYPFVVYFLALSIYRKRDLKSEGNSAGVTKLEGAAGKVVKHEP
jgi:hypothetical protein